jgi:hypothetical protein
MINVNGDLLKRKSQPEKSDGPVKKRRQPEDGQSTSEKYRPVKRSRESEVEQSTSEKCRRDDGSGGFSFNEGIIDVSP